MLFDPGDGLALLGDHLLARVSSNALVSGQLDQPPGQRPEPLLAYRRSLRQTQANDITLGLPGHGGPIRNHRTLIEDRIAGQDKRAERFYALLADGPRSAHEIATATWGRVAVTQAFLTLSEVLGHLGLLLADGRVVEDTRSEVVRFHQA